MNAWQKILGAILLVSVGTSACYNGAAEKRAAKALKARGVSDKSRTPKGAVAPAESKDCEEFPKIEGEISLEQLLAKESGAYRLVQLQIYEEVSSSGKSTKTLVSITPSAEKGNPAAIAKSVDCKNMQAPDSVILAGGIDVPYYFSAKDGKTTGDLTGTFSITGKDQDTLDAGLSPVSAYATITDFGADARDHDNILISSLPGGRIEIRTTQSSGQILKIVRSAYQYEP